MEGKAMAGMKVEDQRILAEEGIELVGHAAGPAREVAVQEWAPSGRRVDAVETVAQSVARVRAAADLKGVGVAFAYAAEPVWVRAGEEELGEAVDVILNAAVECAGTGSIAVRCIARHSEAVLDIAVLPDPGETGLDLGAAFQDRGDPAGDEDGASIWSLVEAQRAGFDVLSPEHGDHVTVRLALAQG